MTALQQVCEKGRIRYARMPERTATERAANRMLDRPAIQRQAEPWQILLARLNLEMPSSIRAKDMRRLLNEMWTEVGCNQHEQLLLNEAVYRDRISMDRAILHSYFLRFPIAHYGFEALSATVKLVAKRRDWPWYMRGELFQLWDKKAGPEKLASALLASEQPIEVLRDAGLNGDLAAGAFVQHALRAAFVVAATHRGTEAVTSGERLIGLADAIKGAKTIDGILAFALLAPWLDEAPPPDHQQQVTTLLTSRIGDPRLTPARWIALEADLRAEGMEVGVNAAFAVLRRWLVRATVREFFAIVANTTHRPDQWDDRTSFWLGYLDAGYITDAWFAFGSQAEREAKRFMQDQTMAFARIEGQHANANQSALLMTIGDVRIAEWSDNGSCRFWPASRPKAPPMYQTVYYAMVLRSMDAEPGYEPLPHMGGSWQSRFARRIYDRTGILHPKYGKGW